MTTENQIEAAKWISKLNMQPHPEGGYYAETYRSDLRVTRANGSSTRDYNAVTSIFYLLENDDYSGFHKIASDEIWYFHKGEPLHIHMIDEDGNYMVQELSDLDTGLLSYIVKAGLWFASEIPSRTGFALVSCAVAPGFEFDEFQLAKRADLIAQHPAHTEIVNRLCRSL